MTNLSITKNWTTFFSRKLFLMLLFTSILIRGASLNSGFATDDYSFLSTEENQGDLNSFLLQDRFSAAAIFFFLNEIGLNLVRSSFLFGILALTAQTLFVTFLVSALFRKISLTNRYLGGAIILSHPYWSEIYTFKMSLIFVFSTFFMLCVALYFIALRESNSKGNWFYGAAPISFVLLVNQAIINYLFVFIIFAFLISEYLREIDSIESARLMIIGKRATLCTFFSLGIYFLLTTLLNLILEIPGQKRSQFLELADVNERVRLTFRQLLEIFVIGDPLLPSIAKWSFLTVLIMSISVLGLSGFKTKSRISKLRITLMVTLIPFTAVGSAFIVNEWWPTPRVTQHVGLIYGFFAMAALTLNRFKFFTKILNCVAIFVIFIGAAHSNQIFHDQERLNELDVTTASRMIQILESRPEFQSLETLVIDGSFYGYANGVKTVHMDLNISAFGAKWSQLPLLEYVSGYRFREASVVEVALAEETCKSSPKWPSSGSVKVINRVGVVCLAK